MTEPVASQNPSAAADCSSAGLRQYLITYNYRHQWSGELRYFSDVTEPVQSASHAISARLSKQRDVEFNEGYSKDRTKLNVVSVVELAPETVEPIRRYVDSC